MTQTVPQRRGQLPPPPGVRELLELARRDLVEATEIRHAGLRYSTAHRAALRAAEAALAATRISVWARLAVACPQLAEQAAIFAASAGKGAAIDAGIPDVADADGANQLLADAAAFVRAVAAHVYRTDRQDRVPTRPGGATWA